MYNIVHEFIFNRELVDINSNDYSQYYFAEAVFVYIQMYKEILSDFIIT